jgi:sialic acid synthase SpsE
MRIGNLDTQTKVLIVAEIGNNHEGSYALAEELIGRAAEAGADAVKFQTFIPEFYVSRSNTARLERLRAFQLSFDAFEKLSNHARRSGVLFFSTPFDIESAIFLNTIQPVFKIASGDNTFLHLIDAVAGFCKPMIISTGLSDLPHIEQILNRIDGIWKQKNAKPGLGLLHCVTSYPVPPDQANLGAIATMKTSFPEAEVGYSDHTIGIEASVLAIAAGARIIEKHFTLDKAYSDFPDHKLSADPVDLEQLVQAIRRSEAMLGTGQKKRQPCEESISSAVRRSIAAARDLDKDAVLKPEDLTWVRPGDGFPPGQEHKILSKAVNRGIRKGELILPEDVS